MPTVFCARLGADLERLASGKGLGVKLQLIFFNLGFQAVMLYRLGRWFRQHGLGPLGSLVSYLNALITGAQISTRADIGEGFVMYHPQGMVIGETAIIGENCTLVHDNLIGQLYGSGDRPTIGRGFYAATGAKILGRVTIGDDVVVGANSVVLRSLPSGVTASGIPARIIYDRRPRGPAVAEPRAPDGVVKRLVSLVESTVETSNARGAIDESTRLLGAGVGLDSIEMLRLICAVEEEFGITVDEAEVSARHLRTVGALAHFIAQQSTR